MKSLGYTVNLIKDSNRIIGCSEIDFQKIRPNTYIKINDLIFSVLSVSPLFYIKDFEVIAPNGIKLAADTADYLLKDDVLDISYKEYEFSSLISIINGGSGYKKGDVLFISGGTSINDINTNIQQITAFEVNNVDENGKILAVGLKERGRYINIPNKSSEVYGGNGSGAVLETYYSLIDSRKIIERTITNIIRSPAQTTVYFNYVLPTGLKEGKLSVNKYVLELSNNYLGGSLYEVKYEVSQDFTFHYKLPLLVKGSTSSESVFNLTAQLIDKKLKEIDDLHSNITFRLDGIDKKLIDIETKVFKKKS